MKKVIVVIIALLFSSTKSASAAGYVTIVNPVRIAPYTKNVTDNINRQYEILSTNNLPSTWLLSYDVMLDNSAIEKVKMFDRSSVDIGILLEVGPDLAQAAEVEYNASQAWHRANVVFLSGYTQQDRVKIIDEVFSKYYELFSEYPKSVGSWWTDSFSLQYVHNKYGVVASLNVADQYETDGYRVWGQPFSIPYYPSKTNAAEPGDKANMIDVVLMPWAQRDPINGRRSSLYSTQDYFLKNQNVDYLEKLLFTYTNNDFNRLNQFVIGLESDLSLEAYESHFKTHMVLLNKLASESKISVANMRDFAKLYKAEYSSTPSSSLFSNDLLGGQSSVFWHQTTNYRVAFESDSTGLKIVDLRIYSNDSLEPYYSTPNNSIFLDVNVFSLFDNISNSSREWHISNDSAIKINLEEDGIYLEGSQGLIALLTDTSIVIHNTNKPPSVLLNLTNVTQDSTATTISIKNGLVSNKTLYRDLSVEAYSALSSKKNIVFVSITLVLLVSYILFFQRRAKKYYLLVLTGLCAVFAVYWYHACLVDYSVPQGEVESLLILSTLPKGRVLVGSGQCYHCARYTLHPIPSMFNIRGYVSTISGQEVVNDDLLFDTKSPQEAKDIISNKRVKYVYLSRYGDFQEKLQMSPGDYDMTLFYENANSQLWVVN